MYGGEDVKDTSLVPQPTSWPSRRCLAVDLTMLRNVVFVYFCVHTMMLYVSYDVPYVYGPARAVAHGMSQSAASFLVSVIGISSTIGQVPSSAEGGN